MAGGPRERCRAGFTAGALSWRAAGGSILGLLCVSAEHNKPKRRAVSRSPGLPTVAITSRKTACSLLLLPISSISRYFVLIIHSRAIFEIRHALRSFRYLRFTRMIHVERGLVSAGPAGRNFSWRNLSRGSSLRGSLPAGGDLVSPAIIRSARRARIFERGRIRRAGGMPHTRLDSRQSENALLSTIAYAGDE